MKNYHRFRLFFVWHFQREEAWINRLSQEKGLQLKRVGCCHYVFEDGAKGAWRYRLELQRRTPCDEAEKHYLRTIGAEEVCRNGEWSYYRIPASAAEFARYRCCDSKLSYLSAIYRWYLLFGALVYIALGIDMTAFLASAMTPLHAAALVVLTALALWFTVELTRFSRVLRHLRRGAAEEQALRREDGPENED